MNDTYSMDRSLQLRRLMERSGMAPTECDWFSCHEEPTHASATGTHYCPDHAPEIEEATGERLRRIHSQ